MDEVPGLGHALVYRFVVGPLTSLGTVQNVALPNQRSSNLKIWGKEQDKSTLN